MPKAINKLAMEFSDTEGPSKESLREFPDFDRNRYKFVGRGTRTHLRMSGIEYVPIDEELYKHFGDHIAINVALRKLMEAAKRKERKAG